MPRITLDFVRAEIRRIKQTHELVLKKIYADGIVDKVEANRAMDAANAAIGEMEQLKKQVKLAIKEVKHEYKDRIFRAGKNPDEGKLVQEQLRLEQHDAVTELEQIILEVDSEILDFDTSDDKMMSIHNHWINVEMAAQFRTRLREAGMTIESQSYENTIAKNEASELCARWKAHLQRADSMLGQDLAPEKRAHYLGIKRTLEIVLADLTELIKKRDLSL